MNRTTLMTIFAGAALALASKAPAQSNGAAAHDTIEERRLAGNPMHYLMSLPEGWTPDRAWPVVVVITDAYREFQATARTFVEARGARPFIIVVPLVLTGGASAQAHATDFDYSPADWAIAAREDNCTFDDAGLTATLADVRDRFHGESRAFIAGSAAGGHVVLSQLFNHPDRLRGVVAVVPNYQARCVVGDARARGAAAMIPVRGFHFSDDTRWGSPDTPWLVQEWERADRAARARGFTNVKDSLIVGEGDRAMAGAVLDFFARLVGR